jgi:hypothetical protein
MFQIMKLIPTSSSYLLTPTDYPFMSQEEGWNIVTELTNDAIESELPDRWTLIPVEYNGRPFKY